LGISITTWYAAVERLDRMGLVTAQPRGKDRRRRRLVVTPRGHRFLRHLGEALGAAEGTPALLEYEMRYASPPRGSPRAGEILCYLIIDAERRADFEGLRQLEDEALKRGRPAEKWMAVQVGAFLTGRHAEAKEAAERALPLLGRTGNTASRRRVLYLYAATLEYQGNSKGAYETYTAVRQLARGARDLALESDAWLGLGVVKARGGQVSDAIKFMGRAHTTALAANDDGRRAKALANLAFAEMVAGRPGAIEHANEALAVARSVGSRIIVARAQLNRALMLAVEGKRVEALEALREARGIMRQGGEERGAGALDDWSLLVRRILRPRQGPYPADWRDQALRLARMRPQSTPEGPRD
jgi:tetratricopeptide (TPR) repeat protein